MNRLWPAFFLCALAGVIYQALFQHNLEIFETVLQNTFAMAKLSVDISIGLIGLIMFWTGLMQIAEHSGLIQRLSNGLSPLFQVLMPDVPKGHKAIGSVTMNMMANVFGLDNAATPMGLKAMKDLQSLNPDPRVATNAQIMFLVINTSSITLFPVTIFLYRAQQGAANPSDVFLPIILATMVSTFAGLSAVCLVQKINLLQRAALLWFASLFVLLASLVLWLSGKSALYLNQVSGVAGNLSVLLLMTLFILAGLYKRIPVYDTFITGAKQGFFVAIRILPFLLAMLVAIGILRSSGVLDLLLLGICKLVTFFGGDTRFVDALPTALIKPLSGSGARAVMLETFATHGVDSFAARLSAMIQGSTETTFYVLAVYFGSVGIRRTRHAIACGLFADFAGVMAAIVLAYIFYG